MNYREKLTRDNCVVVLVDFLDGFLPGLKTINHDLLRKNVEAFTRLSNIFWTALPGTELLRQSLVK